MHAGSATSIDQYDVTVAQLASHMAEAAYADTERSALTSELCRCHSQLALQVLVHGAQLRVVILQRREPLLQGGVLRQLHRRG